MINKQNIIENICYTELVYGRINKKLKTNYSKTQIEELMLETLDETDIIHYKKQGKNYYVSNSEKNIKITINSYTFRIITVDLLRKP
jgi:hypothetical protein